MKHLVNDVRGAHPAMPRQRLQPRHPGAGTGEAQEQSAVGCRQRRCREELPRRGPETVMQRLSEQLVARLRIARKPRDGCRYHLHHDRRRPDATRVGQRMGSCE